MIKITLRDRSDELLHMVEHLSDQNLFACHGCGTCTHGCPFMPAMDIPPDKIIRRVILGQEDVLECQTIWMCAACSICTERCPRDIDITQIMAALRQIHRQRHVYEPGVDDSLLPATAPAALLTLH